MSIATSPTFVQVHAALQSIHPHITDLSPVRAGACSRNSFYDVDRRKDILFNESTVCQRAGGITDG